MLDERVGKPIQHENCVRRVRKSWKKSLIGIKLSSNTKFPHPTRFSIFSQILRSAKPIQHLKPRPLGDHMFKYIRMAMCKLSSDVYKNFLQNNQIITACRIKVY